MSSPIFSEKLGTHTFCHDCTMISAGKIVEYIEHGKFICAAVTDAQGSRLRLLNQNGRELNLPQARVVHASQVTNTQNASREETLALLAEIAARRREIQLPLPLEEVWQMASESNESSFQYRFLTELCFGEQANDDHEAAFLRAIFQDKFYFKYKNGLIMVHKPEVVEQLVAKQEEQKKQQRLLEEGAHGLASLMAGEPSHQWQDKELCLELVSDYYLFQNEAENFETARSLLKEAELKAPHAPFHLMVKAGKWDKHENIPLLRHKIPTDFPQECLEQALAIQVPDPDSLLAEGRRDFRELHLITIDGPGTKDFDDALHIERKGDNFLVGIHISDVSRYIRPGTPLYHEAIKRTTSLYFSDRTIPMLPPALSEESFSLVLGQPRPAISFLVELNAGGEILSQKIVRSVVQVAQQLQYQEAESLVHQNAALAALVQLSQKLREKRIDSGALIIPIPDVDIDIKNNGTVTVQLLDTEKLMRVLVSEFMVLANSIGAEYLAIRQEPGLFRSQAPPQKRLFSTPSNDLYINFRQRRHLARGILSTSAKRHSGVGVEQYTTMTSPIRRALDLVMQLQIANILQQQGALFSPSELNSLAAEFSNTGKINLVRQLRHRYWLITYLENHSGESFPAFILARNNKRVRVVLTDFLLEGDLPPNQAYSARPGDTIMVKIGKASALDNLLRLEWG